MNQSVPSYGFILLASAGPLLYQAQRTGTLALAPRFGGGHTRRSAPQTPLSQKLTMRLDTRAFALASAGIAGLWFTVCAFFVAIAPEATSALLSFVFHYNLEAPRPLTLGGFVGGLLLFSLWVGTFAGMIAWSYNRLRPPSAGGV